jgi:hypothetical protein
MEISSFCGGIDEDGDERERLGLLGTFVSAFWVTAQQVAPAKVSPAPEVLTMFFGSTNNEG